MPRKLLVAATLLALTLLTLDLCSLPTASAATFGRALRYRVIKHTRTYDVVRGHHKTLVLRDGQRYVKVDGVPRYKVVKCNRYYGVLRRVYGGVTSTAGAGSLAGVCVSVGAPASASSFQSARRPAAANDGRTTTRWAASSTSYPQTWTVDLGTARALTQVAIRWHKASSRSYRYRVLTSLDGLAFTTVADRSGNQSTGQSTDQLSGEARYVRVEVLGVSPDGGVASIFELRVYAQPSPPAPSDPEALPDPTTTPTPGPLPTVAPTPTGEPTPTPSPSTPSATPTPTPSPTPTSSPAPPPAADPVAAIAAARRGETVVVGRGTFASDKTIAIPDGVTVVGQGYDASWLRGHVTFGSDTVIRGLKVGEAGDSGMANRSGATNTLIEDVQIRGGSTGSSVFVISSPASYITIRDSLIERNLGAYNNVRINQDANPGGGEVHHITYENVEIGVSNGVATGSPRAGAEFYSRDNGSGDIAQEYHDITLRGCTFYGPTAYWNLDLAGTYRLWQPGDRDIHPYDITVDGCTFYGGTTNWPADIDIEGPVGVTMTNNTFYRSRQWVLITSATHVSGSQYMPVDWPTHSDHAPIIFRNNTVDCRYDNGITPTGAMFLLRGVNVRVEDNTIYNAGYSPIFYDANNYDVVVRGNEVWAAGAPLWQHGPNRQGTPDYSSNVVH